MWWNKEKPEPVIERNYHLAYNFLDTKKRNELFPKLERLIKQAESHYDSGDKELCYEILNLIWRTVDKSKENPVLNHGFPDIPGSFSDVSMGEKPEFPEDRNRIIVKAKD